MSWPAEGDGWAIGYDDSAAANVLVHTVDAGATWTRQTLDVGGVFEVAFADADNGWLVGDEGLHSTHDGGSTWTAVPLPGAADEVAGVTAANGVVHAASMDVDAGGITVASSPIDHDDFAASGFVIQFGAGPALAISFTAGGPYGELVYNDRTFIGAGEIRDGEWTPWDVECPFANSFAVAALSPHGDALVVACGSSGFGDAAPVVGADLTGGSIDWTTIEPAGDGSQGQAMVSFAAATDAGVRVVVFTAPDGQTFIATSTDGGATWPTRTPVSSTQGVSTIANLPDGRLLIATQPSGGMISADGITWTTVATTPVG
jgi:hypothetical protein